MSTLVELVARVREDLAEGDAHCRELEVQPGEWCEVRRADVEALLAVADEIKPLVPLIGSEADRIVREALSG